MKGHSQGLQSEGCARAVGRVWLVVRAFKLIVSFAGVSGSPVSGVNCGEGWQCLAYGNGIQQWPQYRGV